LERLSWRAGDARIYCLLVSALLKWSNFSGLRHIGNPKKGETIFISAASGAVGQVVAQLAKLDGFTFNFYLTSGLRVVGSAGEDKKVEFLLNELGFDAAFNYKKENPSDALPRLCPDGIDIYFENVGGETLDAVLINANNFARIIACGMITTYGKEDSYGVKNLMKIVSKRIRFEGFIQSDLRDLYYAVFICYVYD
jgi:NADPH-dependent curcumin reductase CurA